MVTPEIKKLDPPVQLLQCPHPTRAVCPDNYGPFVTVTVGPPHIERSFYAYKGLLVHHSSYFKAALNDSWKEGATRTVKLTEDNPEVFKAFFSWINTDKLYYELDTTGKIPLDFGLVGEIYVFGDARGAPGLCNAAIDLLIQKVHQE